MGDRLRTTGVLPTQPSTRSASPCSWLTPPRLVRVSDVHCPRTQFHVHRFCPAVDRDLFAVAARDWPAGAFPSHPLREGCQAARQNACCALLGPLPPHALPPGRRTEPQRAWCPTWTVAPAVRSTAAPMCPAGSGAGATVRCRRHPSALMAGFREGSRRRRPSRRGRGSGVASPGPGGNFRSGSIAASRFARSAARSGPSRGRPCRRLAKCCPMGTIASPSPHCVPTRCEVPCSPPVGP